MDRFDEMMRARAVQEDCAIPEGFADRLQEVLDVLPPRKKNRRLDVVRGMAIAAAACVLLVGTAFAVSPGLREALNAALGGFTSYAQEQDDQIYVVNEFEYKVLSALTDGTTVQVYVQQRDLVEGRNSTSELDGVLHHNGSGIFECCCVSYDEGTKTSLWRLTSWGQVTGESEGVSLFVGGFTKESYQDGKPGKFIPLELKIMPSIVVAEADGTWNGILYHAERIELSPLGLTVVTKHRVHNYYFASKATARVCLTDGRVIESEQEGPSGQGSYGDWENPDSQRKVMVWNFRDPVDLDQVKGVYLGTRYFPMK